MPRWLITMLLVAAGAALVWALAMNRGRPRPAPTQPRPVVAADREANASDPASPAATTAQAAVEYIPIDGLHIVEVTQPQVQPVIGSAAFEKDNPFPFEVEFTPWGAGIYEAHLSRYSTDVVLEKEDFTAYPVQERLFYRNVETPQGPRPTYRYPMAADAITVNGKTVSLFEPRVRWRVVSEKTNQHQATFELLLADGQGTEVLRITRRWWLENGQRPARAGRYALYLDQRFENLTDRPLAVRFAQYGPMDMAKEQGYIGDQRHVVLGYLQPRRSEEDAYVTTEDFDLPRTTVLDPETPARLWPAEGDDPRRNLLWAAMTNRYFAAALHVPINPDNPRPVPLENLFPTVSRVAWGGGKPDRQSLALRLESATLELPAGGSRELNVSLYAGPKASSMLNDDPGYAALGLGQLIVYNLGGCCAVCTFAWLANGLFAFMRFIEGWVLDWGVAIMILVAVVRTILHPLTKGSQVNMMKLSKQMQSLQPELEKLKTKYKDNPTKLNQEMMALYREKGVNPASMGLGCLPMFLQMPIWIALYAMLYFAIELRHEPAFWGLFQKISGGNWPFLADLSSEDRFIPLPASWHLQVPLVGQQLTAINILPILMGVVFFIQQKYMTPANPNMSPEMKQQQAMMKWMTVILFPLMLFWAPSGLTLYILTSTAVGIVESKRVRRHIEDLEKSGKLHEKKPRKPGGLMDRLMKAAEARQKMMEEQMKMQQRSGKKKNRP